MTKYEKYTLMLRITQGIAMLAAVPVIVLPFTDATFTPNEIRLIMGLVFANAAVSIYARIMRRRYE